MQTQQISHAHAAMELDRQALHAAARGLDGGAITPSHGPRRDAIAKLRNDALATESVCVLRGKRHHASSSRSRPTRKRTPTN